MSSLTTDTLRHALETARKSGFRVVRVNHGDEKFSAVFSDGVFEEEEEFEEAEAVPAGPIQIEVRSSAVGYLRYPEVLKEGATVEAGQRVAEIVALGIANDVTAKGAGKVVSVEAKDGDALEYGQVILVLEREG